MHHVGNALQGPSPSNEAAGRSGLGNHGSGGDDGSDIRQTEMQVRFVSKSQVRQKTWLGQKCLGWAPSNNVLDLGQAIHFATPVQK
jgi:hypothetical protein